MITLEQFVTHLAIEKLLKNDVVVSDYEKHAYVLLRDMFTDSYVYTTCVHEIDMIALAKKLKCAKARFEKEVAILIADIIAES